jgi:hypothetical protein
MKRKSFRVFANRGIDKRNSNAKRADGAREIKEFGWHKRLASLAGQAGCRSFSLRLARAP